MARMGVNRAIDAAIRTAYAEETQNPEKTLSVIFNRSRDSRWPGDYLGVVSQKGQFEAYNNKLARSLDRNSPTYRNLVQFLADLESGKVKPRTNAVFFHASGDGIHNVYSGRGRYNRQVTPRSDNALTREMQAKRDGRSSMPVFGGVDDKEGLQGQSRPGHAYQNDPQKVKDWQQFLSDQGLYKGAIDGIYGPRTKVATALFQDSNNAHYVDGILGPETRSLRDATLATMGTETPKGEEVVAPSGEVAPPPGAGDAPNDMTPWIKASEVPLAGTPTPKKVQTQAVTANDTDPGNADPAAPAHGFVTIPGIKGDKLKPAPAPSVPDISTPEAAKRADKAIREFNTPVPASEEMPLPGKAPPAGRVPTGNPVYTGKPTLAPVTEEVAPDVGGALDGFPTGESIPPPEQVPTPVSSGITDMWKLLADANADPIVQQKIANEAGFDPTGRFGTDPYANVALPTPQGEPGPGVPMSLPGAVEPPPAPGPIPQVPQSQLNPADQSPSLGKITPFSWPQSFGEDVLPAELERQKATDSLGAVLSLADTGATAPVGLPAPPDASSFNAGESGAVIPAAEAAPAPAPAPSLTPTPSGSDFSLGASPSFGMGSGSGISQADIGAALAGISPEAYAAQTAAQPAFSDVDAQRMQLISQGIGL